CQQAGRYLPHATRSDGGPATTKPNSPETPAVKTPFAPPDYSWQEPDSDWMAPPTPIRFVAEPSHRDEWNNLKDFWNVENVKADMTPAQAAGLVGASRLA